LAARYINVLVSLTVASQGNPWCRAFQLCDGDHIGQRKAPFASKRMARAATGAVEITLPVAIVAAAYIIGQGLVDTWGD